LFLVEPQLPRELGGRRDVLESWQWLAVATRLVVEGIRGMEAPRKNPGLRSSALRLAVAADLFSSALAGACSGMNVG
jgi:hypothetical protein